MPQYLICNVQRWETMMGNSLIKKAIVRVIKNNIGISVLLVFSIIGVEIGRASCRERV